MKEEIGGRAGLYTGLGVVGFLGLAVLTLTQRAPPIYDEVPYLELAHRLAHRSSFREWLLSNDLGPAGPLHSLMHYALSGGVGFLPVPWFRAVNLALLAAILGLMAWVMRLRGEPIWKVWASLSVPMVWVYAGMALTEIPAMVGLMAAVGSALWLRRNPGRRGRWRILALLAVGTGMSLFGRQTYLVVVPALWLLAWTPGEWGGVSLALVVSLIPFGVISYIWGGLVPPLLAYVGGGVAPQHAFLALGYLGVITLLVAPGLLLRHWRWALAVGLALGLVNMTFGTLEFSTLTTVRRMLPHPATGWVMQSVVNLTFAGFGGAIVAAMLAEAWCNKDVEWIALGLGVGLLSGACAGVVHLFSSRYAAMSLPFLVPMLAPWINAGRWSLIRLSVGIILGAFVLISYFLAFSPRAP